MLGYTYDHIREQNLCAKKSVTLSFRIPGFSVEKRNEISFKAIVFSVTSFFGDEKSIHVLESSYEK